MRFTNIIVMAALLLGGFALALAMRAPAAMAGRISLAVVFLFTAAGHFLKTDEMTELLPDSVPCRRLAIWASGVLEAGLAIALLVPATARLAGMALGILLLVLTPLNVRAALRRVDFGGHEAGPLYLLLRLPLQALLLFWAYWFAVR